jgi:hypothetical protein
MPPTVIVAGGRAITAEERAKIAAAAQGSFDDLDATTAKVAELAAITAADADLIHNGAKSTTGPLAALAWGSWVDGLTLATIPGMASKTIKKTTSGDIDVSGAADLAAALAIVAAYVAAHSSCDCVAGTGTLTFTAKAYGSALNGTVISGTMLSAPGTMANGLPKQVSNPPSAASALAPGQESVAHFQAVEALQPPSAVNITGGTIGAGVVLTVNTFTAPAGADNLLASKLCYYDGASSTLLHAKADAAATTRKIMGVTTAAVAAASAAILTRTGTVRISGDASCTPIIGAEAYLSAVTAGTVTSAISGNMYPRQAGYFLEGALDESNTVLVQLSLDDARDDAREWIISDTTLSATATFVSQALTRALWQKITLKCLDVGDAVGTSCEVNYPHAVPIRGIYGNQVTGLGLDNSNSSAALCVLYIALEKTGQLILEEEWIVGTEWRGSATSYNEGTNFNNGFERLAYRVASIDASIGLDAGARGVFRIGSRIVVTGKVR